MPFEAQSKRVPLEEHSQEWLCYKAGTFWVGDALLVIGRAAEAPL